MADPNNMVILTHPDNAAPLTRIPARNNNWTVYGVPLEGIPILFDRSIPQFSEAWYPPKDDRFCGYGPEDEEWMRPLGLGTLRDEPLFYAMVDPSRPRRRQVG